MAYHTEWPTDRRIEALPFDIMPGEVGNIRNDIFLERAIVGEPCVWRWACRAAVLPSTRRCPTTSRLPPARKPTTRRRSSTSSSSHATPARKMRSWLRTHVRAAWRIRALRYVPRAQYRSTASTAVLLSIRRSASSAAAAWMSASITPSSVRSARARQPAAWMPSTATAMAEPILITRSAFPAASAL